MLSMTLVAAAWIGRTVATAALLYYLYDLVVTADTAYLSYSGMAVRIVAANVAILLVAPRFLKTIAFVVSSLPFAIMAIPSMFFVVVAPFITGMEVMNNGSAWTLILPLLVIGYAYVALHAAMFAFVLDAEGAEVWHALD